MFRIGKLTDYALIIMSQMARRPAVQWRMEEVVDTTHLPLATVRKLMRALVAAGLVRSERGVRGGYQLSRLPELVSVAEIIAAIEGPIALTECSDGASECDRIGSCDMESSWPAINGLIYQLLRTLRLSDIEYTRAGEFDLDVLLQRLQAGSSTVPVGRSA